jgi:DNA-binding MarR family transcriptional regulator
LKDRLAHVVRETARALTRDLTARLATQGVSFSHWTFLRILWESDGLTQRELSEQAGVMEPTTAAALKAMEELGYIERRQLPDNRKNVYVHLQPKGRALRAKLEPMALAVNKAAVRNIGANDVAVCHRTLLAILGNLKA